MTTTTNSTAESVVEKINRALTTDHPGQAYENMMMREALLAARGALLAEGAPSDRTEGADYYRELNERGRAWAERQGAPSDEQVARVRRMLKPFGLGDACTDNDLRQALAAAGVAPQEPSGFDCSCTCSHLYHSECHEQCVPAPQQLDPEKVAAAIDGVLVGCSARMYTTGKALSDALCAADAEGRLR